MCIHGLMWISVFLCLPQVQTGFGRLGSHYWGFEAAGVTPDIGMK